MLEIGIKQILILEITNFQTRFLITPQHKNIKYLIVQIGVSERVSELSYFKHTHAHKIEQSMHNHCIIMRYNQANTI